MKQIRLETALGAMNVIASGASSVDFSHFGLSNEDKKMLQAEKVWIGANRPVIESLLTTVLYGVQDCVALARFPVSAEYMAAVLVMFVHPCNLQVACAWIARSQANGALSDGAEELGAELVKPGQLFALVLELYASDIGAFKEKFDKRVGVPDAKA